MNTVRNQPAYGGDLGEAGLARRLRLIEGRGGSDGGDPRRVEDYLDWTARGRRAQARAMGAAIAAVARWLARAGRGAFGAWRTWLAERAAIAQLRALDDHLLADIGLRREDVPLVVRGLLDPRRSDRADSVAVRRAAEVCHLRGRSGGSSRCPDLAA